MKGKHRRTLEAIFSTPTRGGIVFSDIEGLIRALGGEVREGEGSRVVFELKGRRMYLHRPHPGKEARKPAPVSIRVTTSLWGGFWELRTVSVFVARQSQL